MIDIKPIARAKNEVKEPRDDYWGNVISEIHLCDDIPSESVVGLSEFSHVSIVFYMHKVKDEKICLGVRHPRNNKELEPIGIYAQRGKNRPNKIGVTDCQLLEVKDRILVVQGLDVIDGTFILDIKPIFKQFTIPLSKIKQPVWVNNIMENYFEK